MRLEEYFPFTTFDILSDRINKDYRIQENKLIVDVPGFNKKDLEIHIEDRVIQITGKKEIDGTSFSINKKFNIPSRYSTDSKSIKASIKDGILILEFVNATSKKLVEIS